LVVKDAWDDALAQYTVSFVVDDAGGQVVQVLEVQSLQESQAHKVVVRLAVARVVLTKSHISIVCRRVNCEREEDLIVYEDVVRPGLVGVQRDYLVVHDGHGTLTGSLHEIVVGASRVPVCLDPLPKGVSAEALKVLHFIVPVTVILSVESVKGC
jgi:hypothetical protein